MSLLISSIMNLDWYVTYYRWSEADFINKPGLPSGRDRLSQRGMADGEQPSFEILFEFTQYQKVIVEMVIKRRNVLTMERITKVIICSADSAPEKDKMVDIMLTHNKSATFLRYFLKNIPIMSSLVPLQNSISPHAATVQL